MKALKILTTLTIPFFLALLMACSTQQGPNSLNTTVINQMQIKNLKNPAPNTFTGGQPTQEEFQALAASGIKHVINLRPRQEQDWNEGDFIQSLGMEYHSISVAGVEGVDLNNAELLTTLLKELDGQPTVLHCASGNRVGALIALREFELNKESMEDSLATGRRWGLTGLEPMVRAKFGSLSEE